MLRRNSFQVACTLSLLLPMWWLVPAPAAAASADQVLDEILVTGEQPGPAMWKVSKDGHAMWIMGTLSPLPAKMTWRSRQAEDVIQQSGAILANSQISASVKGGVFGVLRLIPALMRMRNNPDGATLREALPPELYARWSTLHQRFFGKDADPKDKTRPLFAADLLYRQALKKSGLTAASPVWPTVEKLARRYKVGIRQREFEVRLQDPKGLIAEVAQIPREKEVACLNTTLDYIEQELPNIKRRAAAWAVGDLKALRALPAAVNRIDCVNALVQQPKLGEQIKQLTSEVDTDRNGIVSWMLLTYDTSFTAMPIEDLLREDGAIARWRAAGYTVEEPH